MATINYWLSTARDGLKKRSALLVKPLGIDLLSKQQTETYLHPSQISSNPAARITLPRVTDISDPAKQIFEQSEVTTGHTHVWQFDNSRQEAVQLRSGGLKIGRKIPDTDFGTNALFQDLLTVKKRPSRTANTLIAPWSHYWGRYYDYLFFVAAKLCRIKDALPASTFAEATVAYPLLNTAFERELLELLGVSSQNLVDSREQAVRFKTVVLGDSNSWFYPNPADVLSLKKHITARMPEPTSHAQRLYISRTGRRRVINEDALIALLMKYDITIVEDKPRSIAEQFNLYASASFIIGPHGASFANLLWCKPGTHLLELFADDYAPEYFRYLAHLLGIRYSAYCAGVVTGSHHSHVDDDILVDLDQLERSLTAMFSGETVQPNANLVD